MDVLTIAICCVVVAMHLAVCTFTRCNCHLCGAHVTTESVSVAVSSCCSLMAMAIFVSTVSVSLHFLCEISAKAVDERTGQTVGLSKHHIGE